MFDRRQPAFTLVEVSVVIAILFLLAAITIPAIQSARETSRRLSCQNNLRQLGIALMGYHTDHNAFPINDTSKAINPQSDGSVQIAYEGLFSIHARLLPYLEQMVVYHAINFDIGSGLSGLGDHASTGKGNQANSTAAASKIIVFICPSDVCGYGETGLNYRANAGVGPAGAPWAEFRDSGNGLFQDIALTRDAYVTDGLSHTCAFSERLRGSAGLSGIFPDRDFWAMPSYVQSGDEMLRGCQLAAHYGTLPILTRGGSSWFFTGRDYSLYTHTQSPNGKVPDCILPNMRIPFGMTTSRSLHFGGINTVMGDGSIRFVSETIDLSVWRGLGTRSGGELVD